MNPRLRWILWTLALGVAGWLAVFGDKTPSGDLALPASSRSEAAEKPGQAEPIAPAFPVAEADAEASQPGQLMRLESRAGLSESARGGVDLFGSAQGQSVAPVVAPPQEEAAPEAPFVLIGRMLDGGRWRVFLERNGVSYVLAAGAVADGYRIDAISKTEVRMTRLADKVGFVMPIDGDKRD